MKYKGSSTLKENVIPGIDVDKLQILDDTYIEENIEYNYGEDIWEVKAGDRIGQGMFIKYCTIEDDSVDTDRVGGWGSTNE